MFKDKKILITGSSGLLGFNFIKYLKRKFYDFSCLCLTNNPPEEFFLDLIGNDDRFEISQFNLVERILLGKFDIILHLATYGQPAYFMKQPLQTYELNTEVTRKLLTFNLAEGGKFLYLSTSEIYSGSEPPHKEEDIGTTTPQHPRACYIESKRCGEMICNIFAKRGVDVKIIRLGLAYGRGVKSSDTRVLNSFILRGLKEKKIDLMDSGDDKRCYIYVKDAINMMLNILKSGQELVYNIGGGREEISIAELGMIIGGKLGVEVNIPESSDNNGLFSPKTVKLDISRYEEEFGEVDMVKLDFGLDCVINWYKKIIF